jgi:hypothetical protein
MRVRLRINQVNLSRGFVGDKSPKFVGDFMSQIFISYCRKDSEFRRLLDSSLLKLGYSIWVDVRDIEAGQRWSDEVDKALDECSLMLLIMSPDAAESPYVSDEWGYFLDSNKPLIPILWKPTKKSHRLHSLQYVDFHNQDYEPALKQLHLELIRKGFQSAQVSDLPIKSSECKPSNIFWICHDLMELIRWLLEDISKQWIDIGFRQSRHHALEIGLDKGIIDKLEALIEITSQFSDNDWNEGNKRQQYAREVTILFNAIAQEIQSSDPNFNSGPG